MLDAEDILNGIVRGALSGRSKSWARTRHAVRGGGLVNARTLLAAAGVAWGLFETWQGQQQAAAAGAQRTGRAARREPAASPQAARRRPPLPRTTARACPLPSRACCA